MGLYRVRETRIDLGRRFGSVGTRLWFGSGASGLGKFEKIGKVTDPVGWLKVSNHVAGRHGDMSAALDGLCDFTLWWVHPLTGLHVRRR